METTLKSYIHRDVANMLNHAAYNSLPIVDIGVRQVMHPACEPGPTHDVLYIVFPPKTIEFVYKPAAIQNLSYTTQKTKGEVTGIEAINENLSALINRLCTKIFLRCDHRIQPDIILLETTLEDAEVITTLLPTPHSLMAVCHKGTDCIGSPRYGGWVRRYRIAD